MTGDIGGWLWIVIDVVFVAVLAVAIAYGTVVWRRRAKSPGAQQARDRATERLYEQEERHR